MFFEAKNIRDSESDESDRDSLRAACSEAEAWMKARTDKQSKLEMYEDPSFRVAEVEAARAKLVKELMPIANRPVPLPSANVVEAVAPEVATPGSDEATPMQD